MRTPCTDFPLPLLCIWSIVLSRYVTKLNGDKGYPFLDPLVVLNHGPRSLPMRDVACAVLPSSFDRCVRCVPVPYDLSTCICHSMFWLMESRAFQKCMRQFFVLFFLLLVLGLVFDGWCFCSFGILLVHLKWRSQSVIWVSLIVCSKVFYQSGLWGLLFCTIQYKTKLLY